MHCNVVVVVDDDDDDVVFLVVLSPLIDAIPVLTRKWPKRRKHLLQALTFVGCPFVWATKKKPTIELINGFGDGFYMFLPPIHHDFGANSK